MDEERSTQTHAASEEEAEDHSALREWIVDEYRSHPLLLRLSHTLLPVVFTAVLVAVIGVMTSWPKVIALITAAAIELSGPGKFIILGGASDVYPLSPFELAALVTYMDCIAAFFLVFNMDLLYRIRSIGPALQDMEEFGHTVLENNRWIRSASFAGVVLFVMFPISGTGALGASVLGRLLGMNRYRIMIAIFTGAFVACFGLAMLAGTIHPDIADHWAFKYLGFPVFLVLVVVAGRRLQQIRRIQRRREKQARKEAGRASLQQDSQDTPPKRPEPPRGETYNPDSPAPRPPESRDVTQEP